MLNELLLAASAALFICDALRLAINASFLQPVLNMPVLSLTKPGEAKWWVPWWAAILFTNHYSHERKQGARPPPTGYQYEIRRIPVHQHSRTTIGRLPLQPPNLHTPRCEAPANDLVLLPPSQGHQHVHFEDNPLRAINAPLSPTRHVPRHRNSSSSPPRVRCRVVPGREMHDILSPDVHASTPVIRHRVARRELNTRHKSRLSFLDSHTDHRTCRAQTDRDAWPAPDYGIHCESHPRRRDTGLRPSQQRTGFHDPLRRQLERDLAYTRGPDSHIDNEYIHPISQTYQVHHDEQWPYDEIPWHMKARHRGHIHYTHHMANQHRHLPQDLMEADSQVRRPPMNTKHSDAHEISCSQEPASKLRMSYERTQSAATTDRHEPHQRPLRYHPVDVRHRWDKAHDRSHMSAYDHLL